MIVRTKELDVIGANTGDTVKDAVIISHQYEVGIEFIQQDGMGGTTVRLIGEEDKVRKALLEQWCNNGDDDETMAVHAEMLLGNPFARDIWNGTLVRKPF